MLCLFAKALQIGSDGATVAIPSGLGFFHSMGWRAATEGNLSKVLPESVPIHPSPSPLPAHLVYVFVPYREGEGEAQGQLLVLHLMLVQEVRDALRDVVKELGVASAWH